MFRNPLYIAIEEVPGASEISDIERLAKEGRALNDGRRIDRDEVFRIKMEALDLLWSNFPDDPAFDEYRKEIGAPLEGFATWMTIAEQLGNEWREWPPGLRHPESPDVATFVRENHGRVRFHAWVQWILDRQLSTAGSAIGIVNDLAIGVEPDGADAWLWQDQLADGSSVGAPPDDYTTEGQHWGVLGFDPVGLRAAAYDPFVQVVRAAMRHAAGIRFDHVMGLWRLFWIPDGVAPADGGYVRYPADDLLDILALESVRAEAFVVGEDLGTVEPVVREEMSRRDMLSYKLLWFQEEPPSQYPYLSLAAANNHDLPTTAGLWTGARRARLRVTRRRSQRELPPRDPRSSRAERGGHERPQGRGGRRPQLRGAVAARRAPWSWAHSTMPWRSWSGRTSPARRGSGTGRLPCPCRWKRSRATNAWRSCLGSCAKGEKQRERVSRQVFPDGLRARRGGGWVYEASGDAPYAAHAREVCQIHP